MRALHPLWFCSLSIASLVLACESKPKVEGDAGALGSASASAVVEAPESAPSPKLRPVVREGSALARGVGEEALYVADEDRRALRRVPLPLSAENAGQAVAMPGEPAAVLPLGDRVLLTVRAVHEAGAPPDGPGLLLVMRSDKEKGLVETGRVELPQDAWGLAVTPNGKTALVSSAWTHKLSAVDLDRMVVKWSIDVGREPRAVVVRADGESAYVTHLVGASITRVDGVGGSAPPRVRAIDLPPAPARTPSGKTLDASLAYAAALSEDGARLFVPRHALGALGQGSWFGAMTVDVLVTASDTPLLGKRVPGLVTAKSPLLAKMVEAELVTNLDIAGVDLSPVVQPRAAVYRKSTKTLLVAGEGDDRVAEFDTLSAAPALMPVAIYKVGRKPEPHLGIPSVCGAPSGLALSADEREGYVFCRSTGDLVAFELASGQSKDELEMTSVHLADDPLPREEALGRRFFYNATDPVVSGGLGCAGCHPEGRDDGHVWHEAEVTSINESPRTIFIAEPDLAPNERGGKLGLPRQTPMLAGRVGAKGPYGWHGQNADLVARLKDGFMLHRWSSEYPKGEGEQLGRIQFLRAFLQKGLSWPPRAKRELSEEEKRGRAIFMSEEARCAKCHVPESGYTDRMAYPMPKFGPLVGFEDEAKVEWRTPSLVFVGGSAPYFHDGRYGSLEELVEKNNDTMGRTSHLGKDERSALVAFLRTL